MPADQLEHLGHVFLQVSRYSIDKADRRGFDVSPPEADEFFAALSEAVIAALEYSGEESTAEFATGLRNDWPRTDRLLPDGTMVPASSRFEQASSSRYDRSVDLARDGRYARSAAGRSTDQAESGVMWPGNSAALQSCTTSPLDISIPRSKRLITSGS